jgi:hypothetical protein
MDWLVEANVSKKHFFSSLRAEVFLKMETTRFSKMLASTNQ